MHWYKTTANEYNVVLYYDLLQREEKSRYAAVIEGHSQEEQEMRKQYDEQMKQMEDEKV